MASRLLVCRVSRQVSSSSSRGGGRVSAAAARRTKSTRPEPSASSAASSLLDNASEFFSSLRWKAANALTASLTSEERQELLERIHPHHHPSASASASSVVAKKEDNNNNNSNSNNALIMEHSIAEAVAAARVQEAQRLESKWEREKEALVAQAQQAAQERVKSDLMVQKRAIAFEQWKANVQQEQERMNHQEQQHVAVEEAKQDSNHDLEEHPILGRILSDLGYKRIHLVPAAILKTIPVWKKQRCYRHDRAKVMASDKMKTLHLGIPGVIALYEDAQGKLSILDGQHRVGMMTILQEKKDATLNGALDLDRILVEVFPHDSNNNNNNSNLAQEIFEEVNKAEPIKLVDMPGVAKAADRKIITDAAARLNNSFADMFRPSQKCRPPHLNVDNLRDALFASNVLERHGLANATALEAWMLQQNDDLAKKYAQPEVQAKTPEAALKKAISFGFYLGLDSSWLYN